MKNLYLGVRNLSRTIAMYRGFIQCRRLDMYKRRWSQARRSLLS